MQILRANVDWFINNGGPALAEEHLAEAMPVTAEKGEQRTIDYVAYAEFELADSLLILVALDGMNTLVGYVIGVAVPSIHNKGFFEFNTTAFYTVPELRSQGVGKQLLTALQSVCAACNISEINYVVSEGQPMTHEVVRKMGFIKTETTYSMKVNHE